MNINAIIKHIQLWRQSQHTKWSLAIIVTAAVLIEVTSAVQYWYANEGIREEVSRRAESELKVKNLEVGKVISSIEAVSNSTLWIIEEHLNKPEEIDNILRGVMRGNSDIKGCGIGFIPGYYASKGRWFEPYVNRLADNRLETLQIGSEKHDYTKADWFCKPLTTGKGYWTEPYFDEAGGKTLMVSYAQPVRDKSGRIVAVFGVDVALDWLSKVINANHIYPSSFNIVISRSGNLMVCPTESLVMQQSLQEATSRIADTAVQSVNRRMLKGESGQATITDEYGEKNYVFFAPIGNSTTLSDSEKLGWSMAVVCSDKEIYRGLRQVGFNLMLLMMAGMALLTYIMFRTIRNYRNLQKVESEKDRITGELNAANRIQQAMLPKKFPPYPERTDIDIYASLEAAREVGGDFYDYFQRDDKLFFCIGDVSGKGVPAALVMATALSAFRMLVTREDAPDHIVTQMNEALTRDNEYNVFITLLVGIIDQKSGALQYCNAGHKPPIIMQDGKAEELPCDSNLPVGAMGGWEYSKQDTTIPCNATLFLYTDGLTEAEESTHAQFGKERMMQVLHGIEGHTTPSDIIERMANSVQLFVGNTEQSDDLTMLAIELKSTQCAPIMQTLLTLPNDISETPRLAEFVEAACEVAGLNPSTVMQVNLAIEEAVVNVMNYAYPEGTQGNVTITAQTDSTQLLFTITDNGKPFDPTKQDEADTSLNAEERQIGGLGIHLMRRYMDDVAYEYADGKNILTLRKLLKQT